MVRYSFLLDMPNLPICSPYALLTLLENPYCKYIVNIFENANKKLNMLKGLKFKVSRDTLGKLYKSLIRPVMEYADVLWDNGIAD